MRSSASLGSVLEPRSGHHAMLALAGSTCLALLAAPALAHEVGLSRGVYTLTGSTVELELVLARPEALGRVRALDANADGALDAAEVEAATAVLHAEIVSRIAVRGGESPCPAALTGASLTEEDGLALRARFSCASPRPIRVDFLLAQDLAAGHRHLAHVVTASAVSDHVATASSPSFTLDTTPQAPARLAFIGIGVEHILLGFDHLVFLLGLILVGGKLRSLIAVVTAFTVAHSVTLGLAVLDVFTLPGFIVEPLIALSIAYVGVENLSVKDARGRWRVTAPFGLIHGFGFAGALGEVGVPAHDVPMTLLLFNVGVELGQLAVMAAVIPVLATLRARGVLGQRGVRRMSYVVIGLGVFWLVERVIRVTS